MTSTHNHNECTLLYSHILSITDGAISKQKQNTHYIKRVKNGKGLVNHILPKPTKSLTSQTQFSLQSILVVHKLTDHKNIYQTRIEHNKNKIKN